MPLLCVGLSGADSDGRVLITGGVNNDRNGFLVSICVPDHKAHEEQPPAAARAWRFAAKNAPAGQRQIRTNIGRDEFEYRTPYASLRHGSGQRRLREIQGQRDL